MRSPLTHGGSHSAKCMIEAVNGQAREAGVTVVTVMGLWNPRRGHRRVGRRNHLHRALVNVTDSVGPGSHRSARSASSGGVGDAVLACAALCRRAARRLAAVPRAGGRRRRLMELLLMAQQQIAAGEASCAFGALERLLLCVGAFMSLQMLEASKGSLASSAHVRSGLICLWRGEVGRRLGGVDRNGRGWGESVSNGNTRNSVPKQA